MKNKELKFVILVLTMFAFYPLIHILISRTTELCPWTHGGFGMFSTSPCDLVYIGVLINNEPKTQNNWRDEIDRNFKWYRSKGNIEALVYKQNMFSYNEGNELMRLNKKLKEDLLYFSVFRSRKYLQKIVESVSKGLKIQELGALSLIVATPRFDTNKKVFYSQTCIYKSFFSNHESKICLQSGTEELKEIDFFAKNRK